jgi:TetR/AcrR family transcriptional repressor of nem operon
VSTSDTAERTRGRPRQFDEDEVLDALTTLFWQQGFESASLAEIVDAAGLNKSSLYNAFGSKEQLFRRVLDRYVDQRAAMLEQALGDGRGLDALLDFVEFVRADATSETGRLGCLAINSTAELGFMSPEMVAPAQRYRDIMRAGVRRPLQRAAELGEIDGDLSDVYVDTAMSYLMAVSLTARGGASTDEINRHLDSMRTLVASWRIG